MIQVDYISSWAERLRSRLYTQFRKPTWFLWIDEVLAPQNQAIEDAIQQLFSMPSIDDSEGNQLDVIGRLIGQPRTGAADDATYRLYLRARIAANRSTGTAENLYTVFNALLGTLGFVVTTSAIGVKAFTIRAQTAITRAQAMIGAEFLGDAKEAATNGILEWQESPDAQMLRLDIGPGLDVGLLAGAVRAKN